MTHSDPSSADPTYAAAETLASVGRSRAWRITFGVLTLVFGVVVLIWPEPTLLVLAVLFGVQLFIGGVFWIVSAFAVDDASGWGRVLLALLGLLMIVVGILCLRGPFQTVAVLALLLGLTWVVGGVIEVVHGFTGGGGWGIFSGVISMALGIILLAFPEATLVALTWLVGLALAVYGVTGILVGIAAGRGTESDAAARTSRPPRPVTS
ncbi:MAG TPA: DUF308 domain-containing protein [Actinophytocola sp.]|uniref:HdeD family acid-resistance protein n=1 Tax=Actinophytocola sp. TaxID=1872138 RepID=UPI002DC055D2|nr:DUF308 domain-containing protein [Actinophytocola sp.]HEU5473511.1 DUF308 domain-containing protein [Actinophytocola sp.]